MNYAMPDYNNCLVNLSNSILKAFGAETTAPTLAIADKLLEGSHKNVVLLLMDAMGISVLEKHLEPDGFLRSHLAGQYSSVFPPRPLPQQLRSCQAFTPTNTAGSAGTCTILSSIRM